MSPALQSFRLALRTVHHTCRPRMAPISQRVFSQRRAISCTPQQQGPANGNDKDAKTLEDDEEDEEDAENDGRWSDADFEEDGSLSLLSPEERLARRIVEEEGVGSGMPKKAERKIKYKPTFLNLGEETPFDIDGLSDDDDDITSLGYIELEQVREMRHYNRVAAWEMPLLAKFAKPFEPPTADTPLRLRYTSYMGELHPAEKKVVLEFCPLDIPGLTEVQRMKLRKLVGVRLNPETDVVRMSCELFESPAQNKRYLGGLLAKVLAEAKNPKDTFEDIPLDTRHHTFKFNKPKMPKEWRITDERLAELDAYRKEVESKDMQLAAGGQLVDGVKMIEAALASRPEETEALPDMVKAGKQGKRVAMRR